jgi:hypothetical protein
MLSFQRRSTTCSWVRTEYAAQRPLIARIANRPNRARLRCRKSRLIIVNDNCNILPLYLAGVKPSGASPRLQMRLQRADLLSCLARTKVVVDRLGVCR